MRNSSRYSLLSRAVAGLAALCVCVGLAGCGSSSESSSSDTASTSSSASASSSSSSTSTTLNQIAGVTLEGTPGEKPTIKMTTPMTVEDQSYVILQEGNGDVIADGNRVCAQGIAINVQDGTELMSTWEDNTPDCSVVMSESGMGNYYNVFKGSKINTTVAIGVNDSSSNGVSYIMVLTFVSQSTDLTKATGTKVTDIPADLPIVTTDENGKPSINMNGYTGSDELVSQVLIEGDGDVVGSSDTAVVKYTGWLLDGTQFDSSWDSNSTFDASMSGGVIQGWIDGLTGKTVGSQVLLVIPPDLGYGDTATGSIPANSTLVFVVDILAKY